jgi:peptidylprolyl isomerase domain and WD repeat-containing protein 1
MVYVSSKTDIVITVSIDGFIKFWRKLFHGMEFMKTFRAHPGKCSGTTLSWNGSYFVSTSMSDHSLKFFDVVNADMINMYKLDFDPSTCEFIYKLNEAKPTIAIAEHQKTLIHILQLDDKLKEVKLLDFHLAPIRLITFNPQLEVAVSIDTKGIVEYWSTETYEFPKKKVKFEYKLETDYIELAKNKVLILSATISHNGELMACYGKDRVIRVYVFKTGKLYRKFYETFEAYSKWQNDKENPMLNLDKMEYERRLALEKEIDKNIEFISPPNILLNETDHYVLWTSYLGIKIVHLEKSEVSLVSKE